MPAFFAYLVAICLLIGTGYAGLVWLTTPPELHQASRGGPAHPHKTKTFSNENTRSAQDSVNSGEESPRNPAKADSSSDSEASNGQLESKSTGANPSTAAVEHPGQQKTVSPGACVPLGMTAKGDLVFPLHCRELVELLPDTGPSVDQSHKTQNSNPTEQPPSTPERSAEATTMEHPSSDHPVPAARTESAPPRAKPTIGDGASRNGNSMRSARQSGRKLGSSPKEEQSTSSSKTVVSQSDEWFNPLGLH